MSNQANDRDPSGETATERRERSIDAESQPARRDRLKQKQNNNKKKKKKKKKKK